MFEAGIEAQSRRKNPPYSPAGGLMLLWGLMLRMEKNFSTFFNVFKIFLKIFVNNEIYQ